MADSLPGYPPGFVARRITQNIEVPDDGIEIPGGAISLSARDLEARIGPPPVEVDRGPKPITLNWHRDGDQDEERSWLVRDLIGETGKGLASGQWGTGKTFVTLDLSASVMTGEPFAGRPVMRRGGVLFVAAEGSFEIGVRLAGLVNGKIAGTVMERAVMGEQTVDPDDLPFAWIGECPRLLDHDAVETLILTALQAAEVMRERYDLPLALIVVDTVAAGAGFEDENSAAEAQKLMNGLERLSQRTGAFILGVDHFGKSVETGTRGSSAKEAAADTVLAMLGTREEGGTVTNTRMAVRKVRGAPTGAETPYTLEQVEIGTDRHGQPRTTCVIRWQASGTGSLSAMTKRGAWPKSLKVFQQALLNALAGDGKTMRPYGGDGPEVRAVSQANVRAEFVANYPAEGDTPAKRGDAKKKAFQRSIKAAREADLITTRQLGEEDWFWLASQEGQI